jgi:hypothetical protein
VKNSTYIIYISRTDDDDDRHDNYDDNDEYYDNDENYDDDEQ